MSVDVMKRNFAKMLANYKKNLGEIEIEQLKKSLVGLEKKRKFNVEKIKNLNDKIKLSKKTDFRKIQAIKKEIQNLKEINKVLSPTIIQLEKLIKAKSMMVKKKGTFVIQQPVVSVSPTPVFSPSQSQPFTPSPSLPATSIPQVINTVEATNPAITTQPFIPSPAPLPTVIPSAPLVTSPFIPSPAPLPTSPFSPVLDVQSEQVEEEVYEQPSDELEIIEDLDENFQDKAMEFYEENKLMILAGVGLVGAYFIFGGKKKRSNPKRKRAKNRKNKKRKSNRRN